MNKKKKIIVILVILLLVSIGCGIAAWLLPLGIQRNYHSVLNHWVTGGNCILCRINQGEIEEK